MEKAREEIAGVMSEPAEGVAPKVQTMGASRLIAESHTASLPIERQMQLSPKRVRVRPGFERAEDEYNDADFAELLQSIKDTGGNVDPIDVRLVEGVPGIDAELLAGTRRLRACLEAGVLVNASVRKCDDRTADMIHEIENKLRKNKSPYSRGKHYQALMQSGRYDSLTALSDRIKTSVSEVSRYLALITDAPAGMWEKVSDPGQLNTQQIRPIVAAYGKPAFTEAVGKAERLSAAELLNLAKQANKPVVEESKTAQARLSKRGKNFIVLLPSGLSEEHAKGAMEAAKKYLATAKK